MKSVVSIALICLTLFSVPAWALFESDKELSEKARVTMVEALKTAQKLIPDDRMQFPSSNLAHLLDGPGHSRTQLCR